MIQQGTPREHDRLSFFPLSDIMDLRHQSSAMCIIMLGGEQAIQALEFLKIKDWFSILGLRLELVNLSA